MEYVSGFAHYKAKFGTTSMIVDHKPNEYPPNISWMNKDYINQP